jgi:hypothetical protein
VSHRIVCAVALVAYAVVVLLGAASGHMLPVTFSIFDIPRALVAVLLALGVFLRSRLADLIAVAYIVWFGIWGVIAILAPIYQFVVPDSAGMRIIPDSVRSGVALASEVALIAAAVALSGNARARRAGGGRMSSPGGSAH